MYRQKTKKSVKNFRVATKTKTNMRDRLRGVFFCVLWYLSILAGFFVLICPILPLVVISPKKYRRWSDVIFGMWEPFPVAMMEVCFGIRVLLTGDKINPFEGSMVIMNHRTRVDWFFLWMGLFHCCQPVAHSLKYVLKAPIMHIPGPGWVMQTCSFIFVHRSWIKDKSLLDMMLDYLNNSDELYQVLLFPEGTDLSESNIQKSHKYADENNLERYYNVLHPRTTGFAFIAHKMKSGGQLKAVYDVTIAYPKTIALTEFDLFRGKFPEEVHFHVKRYSSIILPRQEDDLKQWLVNIWREKEKKLQRFHAVGCFTSRNRDEDDFKVDYETLNVKNGSITHEREKHLEIEANSLILLQDQKAQSSKPPICKAETQVEKHLDFNSVCRTKNHKPSHLLYLVLLFWITLIVFVVYELFNNFYLQIWVLTHSLLFAALSFVGNGFHQLAASIFFYRYKRKPGIVKKKE